jgi:uncharacterized protein involved in exopolysaccharide biosynthesis
MTPAPLTYLTCSNHNPKNPWFLIISLLLLINSALFLIAFFAIKHVKQSYSTQMNLSIPSSNSNMSLNLPNVSSASIYSGSPYGGSRDPRANYQIIAESEVVLSTAAKRSNLSLEAFGHPKIKLVDETTVMQLTFTGQTAEVTQTKAIALYEALQERLDQLRQEEIGKRELGVQSSLGTSRQKLMKAQDQVSDYRVQSGLSSEEQIKDLAKNIEELRKTRTELTADAHKSAARLDQLTDNLGVSPRQATESFALQADPLFQQTLKNYSDLTSTIVLLETKLAPENPRLQAEQVKQTEVRSALLHRGSQLLGRSIDLETIDRLTLTGSTTNPTGNSRETLFRDLVITHVEGRGTALQVATLDTQIHQLEGRLQRLVQKQSGLDALKRDLQMAEAVFSSKLTQMDVNRGNIYDSYPLVQKLSGPDVPQGAAFPNPTYVMLGTISGSVFISSGLIAVALRQSRRIRAYG